LLYDAERMLALQTYQNWLSNELFTVGWFVIVGVILTFYIVWWILVDKGKIGQLLLIGSFAAVWYVVTDMIFCGFYGVAEYKIRLFPLMPAIFVVSVTEMPIIIMLVQQYAPSWGKYLLWGCIGSGVLAFGLLPIYSLLGIFQLHGMNFFHVFLILYSGVLTSRVGYLNAMRIQRKHMGMKRNP
jgi:hypothetical protein